MKIVLKYKKAKEIKFHLKISVLQKDNIYGFINYKETSEQEPQ